MPGKHKQSKSFTFEPFSIKQQKLLWWWADGSPYKHHTFMIADGAIRAGKTIACICSFLQWSMTTYTGETFIVAGRTIGSLKKNVINPMRAILTAWELPFKYVRGDEKYIEVGGNTYYLYEAANESSQDKLQGFTAAGAYADEASLFPQNFLEQMIGRCSVEGSKIFLNCNPSSPKHYVNIELLQKAEEKSVYHLHFRMEDNLTLSKDMLRRYQLMYSGIFHKRYILGLWVAAEGVIYDNFDPDVHTYTSAQLPPKIQDGDVAAVYGSDFGTFNPQVYLEVYIYYKRGERLPYLYVDNEYYYCGRESRKQKEPAEYVKDFAAFRAGKKYHSIIIDPSASPLIASHRNAGDKVLPAKNDVLKGITAVHTLLNTGHLLINKRCKHLIDEFGLYSWDEKKAEHGKEEPIKENDHALDALRYIVNTMLKEYQIAERG